MNSSSKFLNFLLELNEKLSYLSETACKVLDIDYAGVDLIEDKNGSLHIIEVNSIPAWFGLQKVVNFNISDCLIKSFIKKITKNNLDYTTFDKSLAKNEINSAKDKIKDLFKLKYVYTFIAFSLIYFLQLKIEKKLKIYVDSF